MDDKNNFLIENFLNYLSTVRGKSPNTINAYRYDLTIFFKFLAMKKFNIANTSFDDIDISNIDDNFIKKITLMDLYSFISYVTNERKNNLRARARKVACIRSFFNFLHKKLKIIENNPALELETPKLDIRQPIYLSLEESRALLKAVSGEFKERDYAILMLFLNCGLRLSELVNINIDNIKEDKLTVIGKGNKQRTIYLNNACIKAVNEYLKVRPTEGVVDPEALFLSKRKKRISIKTVQYLVKKYIMLANLKNKKYSTHKLRHTAATLMYKYGNVDIRTLQKILGHSSVSTTQIYTHVDDEQLREAMKSNPLAEEI